MSSGLVATPADQQRRAARGMRLATRTRYDCRSIRQSLDVMFTWLSTSVAALVFVPTALLLFGPDRHHVAEAPVTSSAFPSRCYPTGKAITPLARKVTMALAPPC
jgi:hypothetical protein